MPRTPFFEKGSTLLQGILPGDSEPCIQGRIQAEKIIMIDSVSYSTPTYSTSLDNNRKKYRAIVIRTRTHTHTYTYIFTSSLDGRGSIPGRIIPKTQKMLLDASLLNSQHYKEEIKGKVEQSMERNGILSYSSES